jgi:hypothetical protein
MVRDIAGPGKNRKKKPSTPEPEVVKTTPRKSEQLKLF